MRGLLRGLRPDTILNTSTIGQKCHADKQASDGEAERERLMVSHEKTLPSGIIPTREI